jgi:hypothetical protein
MNCLWLAAAGSRHPPINAVVVSKGNRACRGYRDIHAVTVGDLVYRRTGLKVAKREFGEHRVVLVIGTAVYRHQPRDLQTPANPRGV